MKRLIFFTLFITSCVCFDEEKPNLAIPYTVLIQNPFNGIRSEYINEWYYLDRFSAPQPCTDCFGNTYLDNAGHPVICDGWNNQKGFFYYGQCVPRIQVGDKVVVRKYIFNLAPEPAPWCPSTVSAKNVTRIIVKDSTDQIVETIDKTLPEIRPGEFGIFEALITINQNGTLNYEIITDYFNQVDEKSDEDNNSSSSITFN